MDVDFFVHLGKKVEVGMVFNIENVVEKDQEEIVLLDF